MQGREGAVVTVKESLATFNDSRFGGLVLWQLTIGSVLSLLAGRKDADED